MSEHTHVETCTKTGLPLCRRMFNMNLALGYSEEFYSLKALSEMHSRDPREMFDLLYSYVRARECFSREWDKMKDRQECPLPGNACQIDKCFPADE